MPRLPSATFVAAALVCSACATLSTRVHAQSGYDLSVVFVNTPGHPLNRAPGTNDGFRPGTSLTVFTRPWVASDGSWVLEVSTDSGNTAADSVLVHNGTALLIEGAQAPWGPPGETVGAFDDTTGINARGEIVVANNLNGTASNASDDVIAFRDATGAWTVLAREGDLVDPFAPALAGATWDDQLDSPILTETGQVGWRADGIDGLASGSTGDEILIFDRALLAQEGTTVPTNQVGGSQRTWENFDRAAFYASRDGTLILVHGDLTGATDDDIVTVNGQVVLQEGSPVPASGFAEPIDVEGIVKAWVDGGGNWWARGNNDVTEQDWLVRNGTVVARTDAGDPIHPGTTEAWDDAGFADGFFAMDGNIHGDYLVGGLTTAAPDRNAVLMLRARDGWGRVLCREGDPIDLDGNGTLDDNRWLHAFGTDDALLLDDGSVLFVAQLRDNTGAAVDTGFFRLGPTMASSTLRNGTGLNPLQFADQGPPRLGQTWVGATGAPAGTLSTIVAFAFAPSAPLPFAGGEVLIDLSRTPLQIPGFGTHPVTIPDEPRFYGARFYAQAFRLEVVGGTPTLVLLNGLDLVLGR